MESDVLRTILVYALPVLFAITLHEAAHGYVARVFGDPTAAEAGRISPRLPLEVTVHENRYDEAGIRQKIDSYDRRRHATQPYRKQRQPERYGTADFYGWSEDKARQYSVPERHNFGPHIRRHGFGLA